MRPISKASQALQQTAFNTGAGAVAQSNANVILRENTEILRKIYKMELKREEERILKERNLELAFKEKK